MEVATKSDPRTPLRVGVALGAGSAAAMAEIGALEVLSEAGVPVDCVAGTSAGAVVGAALANGRLGDLRALLQSLSRSRIVKLFDLAWPREGLLHGRRALELLEPVLGETIEHLALPYAAVATDLRTGEEVVLRRGPVFDAVRASLALPGVFTPWRSGSRLLVDGGLVNPVPVSAASALGAEFTIALNVLRLDRGPAFRGRGEPLEVVHPSGDAYDADDDGAIGLVEVVSRSSRIAAAQIAKHRLQRDPPGFLLDIPVPDVGMFDLHRTGELVAIGRSSAEAALPGILTALERAVPFHRRLRAWTRRAGGLLAAP